MNYTIDKINDDGTINVTFDIDGISQCLGGMPLDNLDALNQSLYEYGQSYEQGLVKVNLAVAPEVEALVGQTYSLEQVTDAKTGIASISSSMVAKGTLQKGS
jgi:hypothetical protein